MDKLKQVVEALEGLYQLASELHCEIPDSKYSAVTNAAAVLHEAHSTLASLDAVASETAQAQAAPEGLKIYGYSDEDEYCGDTLDEYAKARGFCIGDSFDVTEGWCRERSFEIIGGGPTAQDPKAGFVFKALDASPALPQQGEIDAKLIDFSKPLETMAGEPVKYVCADVIEYKCARVCVDQATGLVYSSPYIGLKIRNAAPPSNQPEQLSTPAPAQVAPQEDERWIHEDMARIGTAAVSGMPRKDLRDAYIGAREDLAIWKKRALEAEELCRRQAAAPPSNQPEQLSDEVIAAANRVVLWLDHADCVNLPVCQQYGSMRADMNMLRSLLSSRKESKDAEDARRYRFLEEQCRIGSYRGIISREAIDSAIAAQGKDGE